MRRRFLYGYFVATLTSWCAMAATQYCFEWQNAHQISDMRLRDGCISIWYLSSFGAIFLQLACIAMMTFPPRFIQENLTTRARIALGSFALVVLLTNPWVFILYIVMSGGTLS